MGIKIFEKRCKICKKEHKNSGYLCDVCIQDAVSYVFINPDKLLVDRIYCMYSYLDVKGLIYLLKEGFNTEIAKEIGRIGAYKVKNEDIDIITYVPSNILKIVKRGYNPAKEIAKEVSINTNIEIKKLFKRKNSFKKSHKNLSKKKRIQNTKYEYSIINKNVKNKTVIIVDDIVTTGSTLNYLTSLIKENGAKRVIGLVVAQR